MSEESFEVPWKGGGLLRGLFAPAREGRPTVVMAHGITSDRHEDASEEKRGVFDLLSASLQDHGVGSVRFDFSGHGKSDGRQRDVSPGAQADELRAVIQFARGRGAHDIALVGASFGAVATALVASREPALGPIVLVNPVVSLRRTFAEPETAWAKESFNEQGLARLEKEGALLLDGEFEIGSDFVREAREVDSERAFLALTTPTLWIHGTEDTYVSYAIARQTAGAVPDSSFISVVGSEHGFGELSTRKQVVALVSDWLLMSWGRI